MFRFAVADDDRSKVITEVGYFAVRKIGLFQFKWRDSTLKPDAVDVI